LVVAGHSRLIANHCLHWHVDHIPLGDVHTQLAETRVAAVSSTCRF
jgi:hypothetical protein